MNVYKLVTDGTDTYAFIGSEWEVVIEDEHEPDVQAFLDYGVLDIPTLDGLPEDCHLLIYDPEQDDKEFTLNIESNPPEQIVTMRSGVTLPFAVTAEEPVLTKITSNDGTVEITNWQQAGNRVKVEITMTKPSRSATASVTEIKVPFTKGTSASGSSESAYDMAVAGGYAGTLEEFKIDLASIEGLSNIETAYEMAVAGGYAGTLEEFKIDLASIEGLTDAIATIVGD